MKLGYEAPNIHDTNSSTVVRLANGELWTDASLGYVCDMWPMPAEAFLNDESPYDIHSRTGSSRPAMFWYPS
jgi:hypothetical protein